MAKFCMKCGAPLEDTFKVCPKCGNFVEQSQPVQQQQPQYNNMQPTGQYQQYPSQYNQKNNKKLFAIIGIVIAVVAVVLILVLVLASGGNNFVGKWEIISDVSSTMPAGAIMDVRSNGDVYISYQGQDMKLGEWSEEDGKLCMASSYEYSTGSKQCVDYSFSNGGNTLTLISPNSSENLVLTKK